MSSTVRIARQDLKILGSGVPKVILTNLDAAKALQTEIGDSLAILVAHGDADGLYLSGLETAQADAFIEIDQPPTGCLAIVGHDQALAVRLSEWWCARIGTNPSIIVAPATNDIPAGVLGELCRLLAVEVGNQARAHAGALGSLVRLREEYEEVREVMGRLDGHLSSRRIGELTLVSEYPPGGLSLTPSGSEGRMSLHQPLDVSGRQLAAIAVHVASVGADTKGHIGVRLVATETDRVLGSWVVPTEGLVSGWLRLDFPTPVQPFAQSVHLDISIDVQGDPPALSLFDGTWDEALQGSDGTGAALPAVISYRAWIAEFGSWYVYPQFWNWQDAKRKLTRTGFSYPFPDDFWGRVRKLNLGGSAVADEVERRLLTCPAAEGDCRVGMAGFFNTARRSDIDRDTSA